MRLSVVVVTWNGAHLLPDCLDALLDQSLPADAYDIWVVDNASVDGTRELLTERYPSVRVVRNARNEGFAGGCNSALRAVTAAYAVLVNNDAVADRGFLATLLGAAEADPRAAAVTAKVLLRPDFRPGDGPGRVILSDGSSVHPTTGGGADVVHVVNSTGNELRADGFGQDRGWLRVDSAPDDPAAVFGFCGAAVLLRMEAVRAAGFFADHYFLYYEDTDLSWRLRLLGWEVRFEPAAVVRHAHAASTGEGSALHRFYDDRNRLLTLLACAPLGFALRALGRHLRTVGAGAVRRAPRTGVRVRALGSLARLLPRTAARRRAIGRAARVSRDAVLALAVPAETLGPYR